MHVQTNNRSSETPICQSSTETRFQKCRPVKVGAQKEDFGRVGLCPPSRNKSHYGITNVWNPPQSSNSHFELGKIISSLISYP